MAKEKVTITLDRGAAERARSLLGGVSTSEAIHIALQRLIRAERLRRDVAAYRRVPPTDGELALAELADRSDLDDSTDWEALYADDARA
jgi:hypothetical protein